MTKEEIKEAVKEALEEHKTPAEDLEEAMSFLRQLLELSQLNNRYKQKEYNILKGHIYRFLHEHEK